MNEAATPSAQAMVARPRSGIPIEVRRGGALGVWLRICQRMRSFSSGGGVVSGAAGAPSSVASSSASRASHHVASSVAKREARGWMRSSATARPSFPNDRPELREARTRPALHRAERLVQARGDLVVRVAVEVREAEDGLLVLGELFETAPDVVAQRGGFLPAVGGAGAVERLVRSRGKALLDGAGTVVPCRRESSPTRAASRRCRSTPRSRCPRRPGAGI